MSIQFKPSDSENSSKITIALCIPAYNAAPYLPRLLRSAAAQEIPFDEILVYDDCSTDDTGAVAKALGATVIRGDTNVGCSEGKNRLLAACSSVWIHFHDADDELLPNFTTLANRWAAQQDAPDVVLFGYEYRDNDTGVLLSDITFVDQELQSDPIRYAILNQINPFCGLYRRVRLLEVGGYDVDPEILYNEDVAFHCKLALAGFTFRSENTLSIVNYRINGSMSGANQVKCLQAHHAVMRRIAASVGNNYPEEIASRLWAVATGMAAFEKWEQVDQALNDANKLTSNVPKGCSKVFSLTSRLLGARRAFRIREKAIRWLKPQLRSARPTPHLVEWRPTDPLARVLARYLSAPDHPAKLRIVRSLFRRSYPDGVLVKNSDNALLRLDPTDFIGWSILRTHHYEGKTLTRAKSILARGGVFVDVGANVGLYTCALGRLPGVRCISVEPDARMFCRLVQNVALNKPTLRAKLFHMALSKQPELLEFETGGGGNDGLAHVKVQRTLPTECDEDNSYSVAATTLQQVLDAAGTQDIDLLKIDVEGYELSVLAGVDWSGRLRPRNVLIEFTDYSARILGDGRLSIIKFFEERGYVGRTVAGETLTATSNPPEDNAWFALMPCKD